MTNRKFFKAKNSVHTDHQLKSKLAWSAFQKSLLLKKMVHEMDGKNCQSIKLPTPTRISFSVQLSTWGKLED